MSKSVKLGDIANIITGPFGSQLHQSDYVEEGIPCIMPQNIGNRTLNMEGIARITEDDASRLKRYITEENDIVYARRGDVEKHAFITSEYAGSLCGTGCMRVRVNAKKAYPLYVSFFLNRPECKRWISQNAVGSNMPNLNTEILDKVPIELPEIEEQQEISHLLQSVDSKIQINNVTCSELEAMAKTLYDYWFVQFDFPDESGKPYRTSGGEMVWNEQLKREIPKGWNVTTINDMTHSYRGVSYDKKDLLSTAENGILVLRGNNIQNNRLVYDTNVAYVPCSLVSKEQQIRAHDIILTMSSGSKEHIGKCTMFQYDSPHTYGAFLTKFTPDSDKVGFVYLSMISDFFKKKIQAICNGTGINNLTNETFDNLLFPKPDKTILVYFEEIVAPLFEKMGDCDKENEELTKLRDWLLPMLMNGQARVE